MLFAPLAIGSETLPNRIALAPINTGFVDSLGVPDDGYYVFHEMYARAGIGGVFIGGVAVSPAGRSSDRSFALDSQLKAKVLAHTVRAIRSAGAVPILQLMHAGRQTLASEIDAPPLAPSRLPCPVVGVVPREATQEDILEVRRAFASAARYAGAAGIRLIELHAAHGYLLGAFLSSYANRRVDEYGGTLSGRLRIVKEVIRDIQDAADVSIGIRISANEFVPDGMTERELPSLTTALEALGVAYVSISAGVYSRRDRIMPPRELGEAVYRGLGALTKAHVSIPVMLAGNITSLDTGSALIRNSEADVVLMGRALLADPLLVRKTELGRSEDVRHCSMEMICKYHSRGLPHVCCPHNPVLSEMLRQTTLVAASQGRPLKANPLRRREAVETDVG